MKFDGNQYFYFKFQDNLIRNQWAASLD